MASRGLGPTHEAPILCGVCEDKASGLHYGVYVCERCKRCFKRSLKPGAQNEPCKKNQQCSIVWYNRDKCSSCRLKKCIAAGMSRDTTKLKSFAHTEKPEKRIPKRRKSLTHTVKPVKSIAKRRGCKITAPKKKSKLKMSAKIQKENIPQGKKSNRPRRKKGKVPDKEMQEILSALQEMRIPKCEEYKITAPKKKSKSSMSAKKQEPKISKGRKLTMFNQSTASVQNMKADSSDEDLSTEPVEDSTKLAQEEFLDLAKNVLSEIARIHPDKSVPQVVCPITSPPYPKSKGDTYSNEELHEWFVTGTKYVIQFYKQTQFSDFPWFSCLSQCDQDVLLKAGVFEVQLVKLVNQFNPQDNSLLCFKGLFLQDSVEADRDEGFLVNSLHDFAEGMKKLQLSELETILFCNILLVAADHPGLRNTVQVRKVQNKLIGLLKGMMHWNHAENLNVFSDLMKMIPTVRILNCLYSKKFMTCGMEPGREPETVGQIIERIFNEIANGDENSSVLHPNLPPSPLPSVTPSKEVNNLPDQRRTRSSTRRNECSAVDDYIGVGKLFRMSVKADSNSSLQASSSVSHEDPGSSERSQTINLVHEVRSTKADESDNEVISGW